MEPSARGEDRVFEDSMLFGRDILAALRTLAAEWLLELDGNARGALSARVLCMAGGKGDGEISGGSETVIVMNVSTRRD